VELTSPTGWVESPTALPAPEIQVADLVSIGLPTFNRAKTLAIAIDSILSQDYSGIELVISDNASTDETQSLCERYAARDGRIRYVRQHVNRGMAANFRSVLTAATGRYFMWLSDDDYLSASYVSRCVQTLQSQPDVSLVCGTARYCEGERIIREGVKVNLRENSPLDRVLAFYGHVNDNGTFYGLMRREMINGIPLRNSLGGDWLMLASIAYLGKILTLDDISVSRSSRGASADVRALARSFGLSRITVSQPHLAIAGSVFVDIVRPSPAFAGLRLRSRFVLGFRSALIVYKRFVEIGNPIARFSSRVRARLARALKPG
jgi:glycosyltransferase involved in cell wall biosynthesis